MNQLLDSENIDGKLNVSKFPLKDKQTYTLNEETPWVKSILVELNENAESKLAEEYLEDSFLKLEIELEKKHNGTYGEYFLFNCTAHTDFFTQCVRTQQEMKDSLHLEFKACIIDHAYEGGEELKDEVDIFMDNDVWELHFYDNRIAMIKEIVHEQIYLNINQYPVSDYDAELPWAKETTSTKQ